MVDPRDPEPRPTEDPATSEPPTERPASPEPPMERPVPPHRRRARTVSLVIGGVIVAAVAGVFLLSPPEADGPDREPGQVAADWNTLDFKPDPKQPVARKTVNMGGDGGDLHVIVHTFQQICWNGYIAEEPIEGCGRAILTLRNAPLRLGLNVTSQSQAKVFFGLAVLDATSENPLESLETEKARGILATTVSNV